MRKHILIWGFCLISQCLLAQISEGGEPVCFSLDAKMQKITVLTMPSVKTELNTLLLT